ncbi:MAG TPA: cytochrome c [Longimicrobiales bacterium]|nr:cytochrome c [Longimicrobiales bacterium]
MTKRALPGLLLTFVLVTTACGHEFEPPDRGERIRQAELTYSPALFDTVTWAEKQDAYVLGNEVYVEKCRKCHGPLGRGQTDYGRERGLTIPSLVEPQWAYASMDSLHKTIYVGHEEGMPVYGDGGISPREIDAVASYVLDVLRPEVIGG